MPQRLCRYDEIPEPGCRGIALAPGRAYADIVLVRWEQRLYAYRNECPHTGAPMEDGPDGFMDYTGYYLQCCIHGALFRIDDGLCIQGPCLHCHLSPVAVAVEDGWVVATVEAADAPSPQEPAR